MTITIKEIAGQIWLLDDSLSATLTLTEARDLRDRLDVSIDRLEDAL